MGRNIKLAWMKQKTNKLHGVTWGIPWGMGDLDRKETLMLETDAGVEIPLQSWPTAYWPDGSVKWTAHAAVADGGVESFLLKKGEGTSEESPLTVIPAHDTIEVNTGKMLCIINRKGSSIINSIKTGNHLLCSDGRLICIREQQSGMTGSRTLREESFESVLESAVVEQQGPVRAVIKVEGRHKSLVGEACWLPFTLRLYFYAGQESIRIVHTFLYDGDKDSDFIKGLGLQFSVPMSGPLYNRHVRFAGDSGLFSEASQLLLTWRPRIPRDIYEKQISGELLELDQEKNAEVFKNLDNLTKWDSYKLVQDSPDHYSIQKTTGKEGCCWLHSAHGSRSGGLGFVGSEKGGLAVGVRNFWQKFPSSLEITNVTKEEANLKVWLWSPDSQSMDLRHYDDESHVNSYYEGFDEIRSTPYGIGNTAEISLWCFSNIPPSTVLMDCVEECQSPGLLVCEPEYYHEVKAFGVWSLVDRSSKVKAMLEDQLDAAIDFYQKEIEQRRWYGFWNYGDIMHTYDPVRHSWRYDMGGYAWQNTELVPNMWLWYAFLRSVREDIFRIAEAMTRHNSEVDVYHLGEYAGLGSRHNVLHWGCGCKEARISMAGLYRFYYYLTGDERTGDILAEVKDADFATLNLDPMRAYYPKDQYPTHTRSGPDWSAFSSNWFTMWERFEDTAYRDKLLKGLSCIKNMPFRLRSGSTCGYDPSTGELFYMGEEEGSHLVICMGAPQVWMEMQQVIKDPEWEEVMIEYGEFYCLDPEEKRNRTAGAISGKGWSFPMFAASMTAYAAANKKDKALAQKVWRTLIENEVDRCVALPMETVPVKETDYIVPLEELPWVSTNSVSQWSLNVIQCLDLIGNYLE